MTMPENPFNDNRLERVEQLENNGINPYPNLPDTSPSEVSEFVSQYGDGESIDSDEQWVLCGRITRINVFPDFGFYDIDDRTEEVQVMCSVDDRSDFETEDYDQLESINVGDWIVFTGTPGRSDTGELTLQAETFTFASPSLHDTADDRNQLSEQKRITDRTAALSTDDELFDSVGARFEVEDQVRHHLSENGYREVQTPVLHNTSGGAEATPFVTHCNALDQDVFLRIAPELYLKRLITAGYDQVYELSRCFRNEDIDTTHNPEFTMLELYERHSTYTDMMDLTEELFATVAESVTGSSSIQYNGEQVDLSPPWNRRTFDSLIEEVFDQSVSELTREKIIDHLTSEHQVNYEDLQSIEQFDDLLMEVFEESVEPELHEPVFVYNYPSSSTPLCERTEDNRSRVQRFEGFICGMEVANSYTELTDPREQRQRLIEQADGEESINEEFVEALSYGMPPTAGLGIGLDRLAMILTDSQSIKDVIAYPMTGSRV